MNFLETLEAVLGPDLVIPKPEATGDFIVKGWGRRRGERALIYTIPNHRTPMEPYEKGVTVLEWEQAFGHLMEAGDFTRSWFVQAMPACNKEGGCNFTTIGGIFELLGYAAYDRGARGKYRRT